jgi:hypothetical protein
MQGEVMDARNREPNGSSRESQPTAPALFSLQKCPNCGRELATVFPLIQDHHKSVEDAPLVCLECCLTARDHS